MEGTPQAAAAELRKVSSGLNEIADKIESNQYDPKDWVQVSQIFSNIFAYIMTCGAELIDQLPKNPEPASPDLYETPLSYDQMKKEMQCDELIHTDVLKHKHQTALEANKPFYTHGGIFIPALGIVLDINPLSESADWHEAMDMAKDAGKRLPTVDELRYVYCYKDAINEIIEERGGTPLYSNHWSSTEYNTGNAWYVNFSSGYTTGTYKNYNYVVRAVAAF